MPEDKKKKQPVTKAAGKGGQAAQVVQIGLQGDQISFRGPDAQGAGGTGRVRRLADPVQRGKLQLAQTVLQGRAGLPGVAVGLGVPECHDLRHVIAYGTRVPPLAEPEKGRGGFLISLPARFPR